MKIVAAAPVGVWLVVVTGATAACGGPPAAKGGPQKGPRLVVASNVRRQDYAGSRECGDCHAAIRDAWIASPMHRMTRLAAAGEIRAPFDGGAFDFKGDRAIMNADGGQRTMRLETRQGDHTYRVTKVIGGRYREDFVGVDVDAGGEEQILPVSWVFADRGWRYKGYSVMLTERPSLAAGPVWRKTCIFCHNTVPYLSQVLDDLTAPGTRGYQGSVSDSFLPADRRWRVVPLDEAALAGEVREEIGFLGIRAPPAEAPLATQLAAARAATLQRFDQKHLVEVGIGCEACHLGAAAHADDPTLKPTFEVRSPLLAARPPAGAPPVNRAQLINRTCLRCHTVLFSQYGHTWEGGHRDAGAGGSSINSGEARDFLLGGCQSQLSCVACHDPHREDPRAALDALATPAGNPVCTRCHETLAAPTALAAHSHHDPRGAAGACLACHMPKKNMGLGYQLTRYHRIGSPTDAVRVERDRPLECALCHADRSVASLVETMERWWGKRYDRAALMRLYGSLDVDVLAATVERGFAHEQAAAALALAEQRVTAAAPRLVPLLVHEIPLLRRFAARALARLVGRELVLDLDAPKEEILAAARAWLR